MLNVYKYSAVSNKQIDLFRRLKAVHLFISINTDAKNKIHLPLQLSKMYKNLYLLWRVRQLCRSDAAMPGTVQKMVTAPDSKMVGEHQLPLFKMWYMYPDLLHYFSLWIKLNSQRMFCVPKPINRRYLFLNLFHILLGGMGG